MFPAPPGNPGAPLLGPDQHGALTIAVAVALAAIIYAAREFLPDPDEGVTLLYSIPIAIIAVRFGAIAGVGAALVSLALFAEWELTSPHVDIGAIGYLSRALAFGILGFFVGRFATERRALIARLSELAITDPLTGVATRARFEAELAVELARSRRHDRPGALFFADLDGFKAINDTLGHRIGDQVLKDVASVFEAHLRATDIIGRMGGDEFVLLLPETTPAEAEAVAHKLRDAIPHAFREVAGRPVTLGLSVGSVCFDANTRQSGDQLLHAADEAMYRDKVARRRVTSMREP